MLNLIREAALVIDPAFRGSPQYLAEALLVVRRKDGRRGAIGVVVKGTLVVGVALEPDAIDGKASRGRRPVQPAKSSEVLT